MVISAATAAARARAAAASAAAAEHPSTAPAAELDAGTAGEAEGVALADFVADRFVRLGGGASLERVRARLLKPDLRLSPALADRLFAAADFRTASCGKRARFSPRGRVFYGVPEISAAFRRLVGLDPPEYVAARFEVAPGKPTAAEFCAELRRHGLA